MCLTKSNITESKIQNLFVDYRDMNILEMAPQNQSALFINSPKVTVTLLKVLKRFSTDFGPKVFYSY